MKVRTFARRRAAREREAAANQAPVVQPSSVLSWNSTVVRSAVANAEARLRAEALERERQLANGPPTAREQAVLKAVSDALLAERMTQNRQGGGSGVQAELVSNVAKLEQKTGLAVDALEQQLSSLQAEVAELRQALLTLNTRPTTTAPRSLLITHADGTTSTLTEVTGVAEADDDRLLPPDKP